MIPVLFETNEKTFTSNGIGRLSGSVSCYVFEERNGAYELELEYPISGSFFNELKNDRIILANPSDGKQSQPFRIFKISKPISGIVTVYAKHISYDLSGIPVAPFSATSCSGALSGLIQNSMIPNEFSVWTDISSSGNFNMKSPSSFRNKLGGEEGSILQKFGNGAELEFDRFTIKVFNNRGSDNGVTIRYGKNLTDLKQEESVESVWTGAVGYWFKENTETNTSELVSGSAQYIPNHADYPRENLRVLDFTNYFDSKPTVAQLNSKTVEFINSNKFGIPKVSIDIAFANLWQTEEFSSLSTLERVKLCDTVHVIFEDLGVNATAKVIKTEYDVLKDSYSRISLGEARTSFAESIQENTFEKVQPIIKSALETAISNATEQIAGSINMSGYVTQIKDGNGNWSELVISDNADYTKATNVWRWTQGGLGFSRNGYAGPYETAITSDGHINGQMITAGSINASTINIGARTLTETLDQLSNVQKLAVKSITNYYIISDTEPPKTDTNWSTTKPTLVDGQTLWLMQAYVLQDGREVRLAPNKDLNKELENSYTLIQQNREGITKTNGNITTMVEEKTQAILNYQNALGSKDTELQNQIETLRSQLQLLSDSISLSVEKTTFDGFKQKMEALLDIKGLHIGQDGKGKANLDSDGLNITDSLGNVIAKFTNDDSRVNFLNVREHLSAGSHRAETFNGNLEITKFENGKIETTTIDGTAVFWIGDVK